MSTSPPLASPTDLRTRRLEAELMDDPELNSGDHRAALRALSRVHLLSGTGPRLRRVLDRVVASRPSRPLRVLDLACGGGDATLDIARWSRARGVETRVTALDLSETALGVTAERAAASGLDVELVRADALNALPEGEFDLICSSLFLHHLTDEDVVRLLRSAGARGAHLHIEDLRRSRLGLALAWGTLRVVSRSRVAHVDGPRSVRAAWSRSELEELAQEAGLAGAQVRWAWPERWVLSWSRG